MANTATCVEVVSRHVRDYTGGSPLRRRELARRAEVSERSVSNWETGVCAPHMAELIRLSRECRELANEVIRLLEEGIGQ